VLWRYTPVADQPAPLPPSFGELLKHGQVVLSGLEALEAKVAADVADHYGEVRRLKGQVAGLEGELSNARETQRRQAAEQAAERDRLTADIDTLRQELEAAGRQREDEQRGLQDERKALMASHDEERAELEQRLAAREAALDQRGAELRQLQQQLDDLEGSQLTLHAERQQVTEQLDQHRSVHDALQAEHRTVRNQLAEATAELETLQGYQLQWAAEREDLLAAGRARKEEYDKLSRAHAELIAQASKLNSEAGSRRQTLVTEIQQLNKELNEAMSAIARNQERDRQREKVLEALKESWQREKTELEIALRDIRKTATAAPISPDHLHSLKSHLNVLTGFSELLLQEGAHAITPEERVVFLRQINESGKRFAQELARLSPTNGEEAAGTRELVAPESTIEPPEILIADPDPATPERIEPFLTRAGYHVVVAANASQAMERALAVKPIVVLIDAAVPPHGAAQLIEDLRRERRTRDVPVVLTSQDASVPPDVNGAHLDFLPKPIDRQRLLQVLVKLDLLADNVRARRMPGSVLVIDDDRQHIRLVEATLKPYKVAVLGADSGQQGITLAHERHPDLVILDLMMPHMDGYQVVEALRAEPDTSGVPIIVYTAKNITKADQERLAGKIQSIIPKGEFNKDRLLNLIQKRGERRRRSRSEDEPPVSESA
jgi:CheY-like chemotaxis protein